MGNRASIEEWLYYRGDLGGLWGGEGGELFIRNNTVDGIVSRDLDEL